MLSRIREPDLRKRPTPNAQRPTSNAQCRTAFSGHHQPVPCRDVAIIGGAVQAVASGVGVITSCHLNKWQDRQSATTNVVLTAFLA